MPNVFREQAEDRFTRSLAFLTKADTLLQDDLVNRSALADAVSAIKNMLQGYLLLRISQTPETGVTQRWQEIAASNSMPDLLQACGEAGLDLRGLAVEIKALNRERNRRMHDDPGQRIETPQARQALDLARNVQRRIRAAVQGKPVAAEPETAQSAPARIATIARAAVSGQLGRSGARPVEATPTAVAGVDGLHNGDQHEHATASGEGSSARTTQAIIADEAKPTDAPGVAPEIESDAQADAPVDGIETLIPDEADSADDAGDSGDTRLLAALTSTAPERQRRRSRVGRVLVRALLAAATLLIGVAAGAGLMFPVATGHAPGWLAFATTYLPATPTPTAPVAPTATATATPPQSGPYIAGALTVTPSCFGGAGVTLTNTGAQPVRWSIGSPDSAGVLFALPGGNAAAVSQSGVLKAGGSVAVSISDAASGAGSLVVISSTGTVQLPAPAC